MVLRLEKTSWHLVVVVGVVVALAMWSPVPEHELPADTPWHVLMQAEDLSKPSVLPDTLRSLDGQSIMLTGFIYPLDNSREQQHFLLSPYPQGCAYHVPMGPASTVEVFAEESMRFTNDAVAVQGVFTIVDWEGGLRYQLHAATVEDYD